MTVHSRLLPIKQSAVCLIVKSENLGKSNSMYLKTDGIKSLKHETIVEPFSQYNGFIQEIL